jgi:hypothetical protein
MEIRELHAYIDPESQQVRCTSEAPRRTAQPRRARVHRKLPVVGIAILLLVCVACLLFAIGAVFVPWKR